MDERMGERGEGEMLEREKCRRRESLRDRCVPGINRNEPTS